eukprot:CAMPEP_0201488640 /NCGR_PEP_ID=MMETSP0151_2-20130828/19290_1 /ASSEMBLY_ACC=CAM_ASM_000257 /TAXON_ID=200890 /ORGANISM="Paramoeba atlantica, Strain 621/1 / CCAP 1560/9" /LENGTH=447 /DNA_ID=CAMNT_0047873971 /DNA_START=117 /DNA_END=1461 /DNA_ORIENTATION=+
MSLEVEMKEEELPPFYMGANCEANLAPFPGLLSLFHEVFFPYYRCSLSPTVEQNPWFLGYLFFLGAIGIEIGLNFVGKFLNNKFPQIGGSRNLSLVSGFCSLSFRFWIFQLCFGYVCKISHANNAAEGLVALFNRFFLREQTFPTSVEDFDEVDEVVDLTTAFWSGTMLYIFATSFLSAFFRGVAGGNVLSNFGVLVVLRHELGGYMFILLSVRLFFEFVIHGINFTLFQVFLFNPPRIWNALIQKLIPYLIALVALEAYMDVSPFPRFLLAINVLLSFVTWPGIYFMNISYLGFLLNSKFWLTIHTIYQIYTTLNPTRTTTLSPKDSADPKQVRTRQFLKVIEERHPNMFPQQQKHRIVNLFEQLQKDGSIKRDDLQKYVEGGDDGNTLTNSTWEEADKNADGSIDFEEFVDVIASAKNPDQQEMKLVHLINAKENYPFFLLFWRV